MTDTLKPIITFKAHPLGTQFYSPLLDQRLQFIIYALAGFVYTEFGKAIEITEIFRTKEEQDAIYANDRAYQVNPWESVHMVWRGVDISVKYLTEDEIKEIVKYFNSRVNYGDNLHATAICHDVGYGLHLHFQVNPDTETILQKT